jgi:hypothetical protein
MPTDKPAPPPDEITPSENPDPASLDNTKDQTVTSDALSFNVTVIGARAETLTMIGEIVGDATGIVIGTTIRGTKVRDEAPADEGYPGDPIAKALKTRPKNKPEK